MMDGWKERGTDSHITSRIYVVQKGGDKMLQSYFLVLTRSTMADGLPQVTGKRHQGHPVTAGMTAS